MNLRAALIAGIVVFSAAYLAVSHVFFNDTVESSKKYMIRQTRISLREISDRVALFLADRNDELKVFSAICGNDPEFPKSSPALAERLSKMKLAEGELFVTLDKNGDSVFVAPSEYKEFFASKKPEEKIVFKTALERKSAFVTPSLRRTAPDGAIKNIMLVCSPVLDANGSVKGVVALGFTVDKLFADHLKPLEFDNNMVCVTDLNDVMEICRDANAIGSDATKLPPPFELPPIPDSMRKAGYHGHFDWKDKSGKEFLIIYHPIEVDGRTLLAQLKIRADDISQFLRPFYFKHTVLLLMLAFIGLAASLAAFVTSRRIKQMQCKIADLEIQIDEERKRASVESIASSDYFIKLQEHASKLKDE